MKYLKFTTLILTFLFCICNLFARSPFLIYYGDNASINYLNNFKVVVLDPDHYNYVFGLKAYKYGYVSIGEVENYRDYFKFVKNMGVLLKENKNWKGAYYVSLKSGKWQDFVINYIIPSVLAKGYNGIFLDTVDSLLLNHEDKGLIIKFINSIKKRFPHIKLMLNRGFAIANMVDIDAILLESTITTYNFKTQKYSFLNLNKRYQFNKKVEEFSVDYWYLNDIKTIEKIYKKALKLGYKPFVSDISLQKLPKIRYDEDSKSFVYTNNNM